MQRSRAAACSTEMTVTAAAAAAAAAAGARMTALAAAVAAGACGGSAARPVGNTAVAPPAGILARADAATRALAVVDADSELAAAMLGQLPAGDGCAPPADRVRAFELAATEGGVYVHALGSITVADVACWFGGEVDGGGRAQVGEWPVAAIAGGVALTIGAPIARPGPSRLAARFAELRGHEVTLVASVGPATAPVDVELTGEGAILDGWVFTFADEATAREVEAELATIFRRAGAIDPRIAERPPRRRGRAIDFTGLGATVGALGGALRTDVVEAFRVPAASMAPTLLIGDLIYAVKPAVSDPPRRGDVVIVKVHGRDLVKRIVGVGGDTVTVDAGGLTIDGVRAPRTRRGPGTIPDEDEHGAVTATPVTIYDETIDGRTHAIAEAADAGPTGTWTVPAGHLFLVGDFRDNSHDSRSWGALPADALVGTVRVRWFATDARGVAWDRVMTAVR